MTALLVFGLKVMAAWLLVGTIVAAIICTLITRGKMDSHRRQYGACDGDPFGSRGGSQRGPNIDHSTLV